MWYEFSQNNTGGSFDVDDKVCHRLFIEADTEHDAEMKAFDLGVYYNGCEDGIDCPCCGDRWYGADKVDDFEWGDVVYKNIEDYAQNLANKYGWTKPDIRIFHASGDVVEIFKDE